MDEIKNGCLWLWEQQTDYILCEGDIETLPTLFNQDEERYFYNQYLNSWSMVSCTIFAAVWMLSDLMNYKFSYDEIKEIDDLSYTRWRIKWQGWYVQNAVKLVADWWNERKSDKVAYYRISKYNDEVIEKVLSKNYTLDTNYNGNKKYWDDKKDGVLDGTDFGVWTYGHSVDIISNKGKRSVKDSWSTNQIYELKHKISEIKCYWSYLYLYTKVAEDNLEEVKRWNEIRVRLLQGIPLNSELWNLTKSKVYQNKLHDMNNTFREWLDYIDNKLKSLS